MLRIRNLFFSFLLVFLTAQVGKTQDSLRTDIKDTTIIFRHSPTRAAILSAVMPGMGQIYNRKYWKLPLIYGGMGTLGYYIIHFNNLYQKYRNAYIRYNKFGDTEVLNNLPKFNKEWNINTQLVFYKDAYRRYRDMDIMIMGAVYVLNIIDATVDAYFFNYDISDNLSMRIEPTMINTIADQSTPGIKLSFNIR